MFENSAFLEDLNREIEKIKCTQSDSNMNFSTWNALFLSVVNKHAPIKAKRVKRAKKSASLTEEITAAQKNRDYHYKQQDWEILSSGTTKQKASFVLQKKLSLKMLSMKTEIIHSFGSMLKS